MEHHASKPCPVQQAETLLTYQRAAGIAPTIQFYNALLALAQRGRRIRFFRFALGDTKHGRHSSSGLVSEMQWESMEEFDDDNFGGGAAGAAGAVDDTANISSGGGGSGSGKPIVTPNAKTLVLLLRAVKDMRQFEGVVRALAPPNDDDPEFKFASQNGGKNEPLTPGVPPQFVVDFRNQQLASVYVGG